MEAATSEFEREVERNYRWNFAVNLLDGAFFWFGLSFISSSTIIPLFVSKLTSSALLIGLIAVIGQGSWYLPQVFTANFTERMPRKKARMPKAITERRLEEKRKRSLLKRDRSKKHEQDD